MAPSGLVINKLGVQATASDDLVRGLLCLKISLPKDNEGRTGARWALFNSTPPKLVSQPAIHPLPLPLPSSRFGPLRIASTLLSLPAPTSYPPSSPTALGGKPYIDVSSTTGKVYVVVDPVVAGRKGGGRSSGSGSGSGGGGRKEWLIMMDFEMPIAKGSEDDISKVLLPLPRCLDNVVRFQILPPPSSSASSSEIKILTEPKMLSLPPTAFSTSLPSQARRHSRSSGKGKAKAVGAVGAEEGWEDGEDLGPDDIPSEESEGEGVDSESEESDDGGSWLEGIFQSTDVLRLEWSFSPADDFDLPSLQVTPVWDSRRPAIQIRYAANLRDNAGSVPLEIDVPDGWGWSNLSIDGDGLTSWRSIDSDWWSSSDSHQTMLDPDSTIDGSDHDDSFATVRAKRSRHVLPGSNTGSAYLPTPASSQSSASLMRQTFPAPLDMKVEDYSFEMGSMEQATPAPRPLTPVHDSRRSPITGPSKLDRTPSVELAQPRPAKSFELAFDETTEPSCSLQGTLVPLSPLTLVSPALPIEIPFITVGDSGPKQCHVQCSLALHHNGSTSSSERRTIDITQGGTFRWMDSQGRPLSQSTSPIKGDVKIKLRRNVWGAVTMLTQFSLPGRGDEAGFTIHSEPGTEVRISKATLGGVPIARHAHDWGGGRVEVRVGKREGKKGGVVEVILEMHVEEQKIGLPTFEEGSGVAHVELYGDGWEAFVKNGLDTNLTSTADSAVKFTYDLAISSLTPPYISVPSPGPSTSSATGTRNFGKRAWNPFSFSTFVNLLLLWMLLSMFQQVQRLRNEVAFVVDETRDLRLYGFGGDHSVLKEYSKNPREAGDTENAVTDMRAGERDSAVGQPVPKIEEDHSNFPVGSLPPASGEVERPKEHALARVVFGQAGWQRWAEHPTVRNITKSVVWLWRTVVKLIL